MVDNSHLDNFFSILKTLVFKVKRNSFFDCQIVISSCYISLSFMYRFLLLVHTISHVWKQTQRSGFPVFKDQFLKSFIIDQIYLHNQALCKSLKIVLSLQFFFICTQITCSFAFKQENIEKKLLFHFFFNTENGRGGADLSADYQIVFFVSLFKKGVDGFQL